VPKRKRPTWAERAAPYVDSPLMTYRVVHKRNIAAIIEGNFGVYRTRKRIGAKGCGHCTCPSELFPCKHIRALEATWQRNPESFFNLQPVLQSLAKQPRDRLIQTLADLALGTPEVIEALG